MKVYRVGGSSVEPPYKRIGAAHALACEQHPDSTCIRIIWTPASDCELHAEVYDYDGSARVVPVAA